MHKKYLYIRLKQRASLSVNKFKHKFLYFYIYPFHTSLHIFYVQTFLQAVLAKFSKTWIIANLYTEHTFRAAWTVGVIAKETALEKNVHWMCVCVCLCVSVSLWINLWVCVCASVSVSGVALFKICQKKCWVTESLLRTPAATLGAWVDPPLYSQPVWKMGLGHQQTGTRAREQQIYGRFLKTLPDH